MNKQLIYQHRRIHYRVVGNGEPVIFIHGFGEEGTVWNNQLDELKDKFKLIIPDLPGSGQSELIPDMSIEGMAETIHAIIHQEDMDSCVVIGHSMGGYIALALVEKYWNHVHSFGLFHSSAFADNEEKKVARRKGIDFINREGAFAFLKNATPNLFSPVSRDEIPGLIDEFIGSLNNFSASALVSYYEAMMRRPDRTALLRNASKPVLFVMGKYDTAVPLEDGLKQCHLPEKSYIHILHLSGHMGMMEEPVKSSRILEKFLLETSQK